jgi:hypothetical protein
LGSAACGNLVTVVRPVSRHSGRSFRQALVDRPRYAQINGVQNIDFWKWMCQVDGLGRP